MNQQYINAKQLKLHIDELIIDGYTSFFDLPRDDQELLAACYIAQDKSRITEFLPESPSYATTMTLLVEYMRSSNQDIMHMLVDELKSAAVKYYENELSQMYDYAYADYQAGVNEEHGMTSKRHKDNGDQYWVRG